ncbi:MAG: MFS transporter [Nanoarchaeota archaeon]|nr:MFS transporter [Nanoarchaeota archaeon]
MKKRVVRRIGLYDYILFSVVYFVQGALGIAALALPLFLKYEMNLSIPQIATVYAITSWPWVIKPIYGLFSDYYPIKRLRRKPYLFIACAVAALGWLMTAYSHSYLLLVIAQSIAALGIASTDVFADGLAVQKSTRKTKGRIQAICWGSRSLGAVLVGFFSGYLLNFISYRTVFGMTAILPMFTFVAILFVREEKHLQKLPSLTKTIKDIVQAYIRIPMIWIVALFLFIWFVGPAFGIPLLFLMKEVLGFSETFLGILRTISSIGGVIGAVLFWKYLDRFSLRKTLFWLVLLNVAITLIYYFLINPVSALIIYFISGMLGIITMVACMKLVVGICPRGIEATTFALVAGISNLASSVISPYVGGQIFALLGLKPLILISALTGLVPLLLLRYFKK